MSPLDLAKQMNEEKLIKYMNKPRPAHEMKEKLEKSKSGGLFKSKKSSDEKIEDYIKNYQINNFLKEYKEIIDKCNTYTPIEDRTQKNNEQLALVMYVMMNRSKLYTMNCANPYDSFLNCKDIYYNHDYVGTPLNVNRRTIFRPDSIVRSIIDVTNEIIIENNLNSKTVEEAMNVNEIFSYSEPTVDYSPDKFKYKNAFYDLNTLL